MAYYLDQRLAETEFTKRPSFIGAVRCYIGPDGMGIVFGLRPDTLRRRADSETPAFLWHDKPVYGVTADLIERMYVGRRVKQRVEFPNLNPKADPVSLTDLLAVRASNLTAGNLTVWDLHTMDEILHAFQKKGLVKSVDGLYTMNGYTTAVFKLYATNIEFRAFMDSSAENFLKYGVTPRRYEKFKQKLDDYLSISGDSNPSGKMTETQRKKMKVQRIALIKERYKEIILLPREEIAQELASETGDPVTLGDFLDYDEDE